ncbi:MAG TPA: GNAT family N-acetyltransferase [Kofleriaceae bacterium]|nr:GNAT family N-acetyltransferase [Kofleriaceae bacterium]
MMHVASYRSEGVLRDGTSILIRRVTNDDRDRLRALFARMSPESIRHRFFAAKRELTDEDLAYVSDPSLVALAAIAMDRGQERILGVGRYHPLADTDPPTAEVAFDVGDADQGRGIATLLLDHLARIARSQEIELFRAEVEADNGKMLEVFRRSGFDVRSHEDGTILHVDFPTNETERFLGLAAERERFAASRSLRPVFAPTSIAVIGASRTPGTIGRAILDNLIRDGFRGEIFIVNEHAKEVAGRPCFPSVTAIGKPVDLAIVSVPARAVEGVIRECAQHGVRAAVIITAGFAEAGEADTEERLRQIARAAGMRIVGPNCMGVLAMDPAVRMNATFSPVTPPAGNISMVSQSGALGLAMLDHARHLELGIADFISIGNKADVSVNDVLSYWHDQPRTRVIALYLESFGNPRTFARLAPEVARERPIVAVKSGRTAAGTRAASSHSAALASMDIGVDALFAQTGVIRVDTLEQMFDLVALLSSQPVPAGPRVGVVTNAGGPGILLADACEARGLTLPRLTEPTLAALRELLPSHAGFANPIDIIASAPADQFEAAIRVVGNDPNVDSLVVLYVPPLVTRPEDVAAAIARGAAQIPRTKPIATVFLSSKGTPSLLSKGERGAIPSYAFPENVALALAAAVRYGAWRKRPRGERATLTHEQTHAVRDWLRGRPSGWVDFTDLARLLELVGVEVAAYRVTRPDPALAIAAARDLGYPVVVKAIAPGLLHKSDVGGVALHLRDEHAVRAAVETMRAKIPLNGLLVQRQVKGALEGIVGVTSDATLGSLVLAGIGGTAVELYKDVSFRVAPLTDVDAREMIDSLRGRALLDGFRGAPAADRGALIHVIERIAALVDVMPEIAELDLNPVMVLEPGDGAIVVDGRLLLRTERGG